MPLALLPVVHPGTERRIHVAFQKTKEYALGQMLRSELELGVRGIHLGLAGRHEQTTGLKIPTQLTNLRSKVVLGFGRCLQRLGVFVAPPRDLFLRL